VPAMSDVTAVIGMTALTFVPGKIDMIAVGHMGFMYPTSGRLDVGESLHGLHTIPP
jgi:hypothetical protein